MTCREKLAMEHPGHIKSDFKGGCFCCPTYYGYLGPIEECNGGITPDICTRCWDREIPGTEEINKPTSDDIKKALKICSELKAYIKNAEKRAKKEAYIEIYYKFMKKGGWEIYEDTRNYIINVNHFNDIFKEVVGED